MGKKSFLKLILVFILLGLILIVIFGLIGFFFEKKQTNVQNLIDKNYCTADTDCGINYCGCEADLLKNIDANNNICAQDCPGVLKCINSKCVIVK